MHAGRQSRQGRANFVRSTQRRTSRAMKIAAVAPPLSSPARPLLPMTRGRRQQATLQLFSTTRHQTDHETENNVLIIELDCKNIFCVQAASLALYRTHCTRCRVSRRSGVVAGSRSARPGHRPPCPVRAGTYASRVSCRVRYASAGPVRALYIIYTVRRCPARATLLPRRAAERSARSVASSSDWQARRTRVPSERTVARRQEDRVVRIPRAETRVRVPT